MNARRFFVLIGMLSCMLLNAQAQNIYQMEYFFDTDPGVGNGTRISVGPSDPITFSTTISTAGLEPGHHWLYIRTRTTNYKWSLSEPRLFTISSNIEFAEYFFDEDPGVGNGNPIVGADLSSIVDEKIPTDELGPGNHILYIRTSSYDGRWSLYEARHFTINANVQAEYFVDTDPGVGNGSPLPAAAGVDAFIETIPTTSLKDGQHMLYIRTRMGTGNWSLSEPRLFYIRTRIMTGEYFIDTDPGFRNGTPLPIATPSDMVTITPTINIGALPDGTHHLFVRTKDALGIWSMYEPREFIVDSALPVELLEFKATPVASRRVKVEWTTETEINNDHFVVQHSTNGAEFTDLGKVKGAGNSFGTRKYDWIHDGAPGGSNYYRLKQTDLDGTSTLSKIVLVDLPENDGPMVYPNPSAGDWFVGFDKMGAYLIEVFDVTGRKCMELFSDGTSQVRLPRSDTAAGTYLVRIMGSDGTIHFRKQVLR